MVWHRTDQLLKVSQETLFPVSWRSWKRTSCSRSVQQRGQVWVTGWSLTPTAQRVACGGCHCVILPRQRPKAAGGSQLAGNAFRQALYGRPWGPYWQCSPKASWGWQPPRTAHEPGCLYMATNTVLVVKNPLAKCRTHWGCEFDPCVEKIPGEGNGNPLQYSCPENSMNIGAWWSTVPGVMKSWTRLSEWDYYTISWCGRCFHFHPHFPNSGTGPSGMLFSQDASAMRTQARVIWLHRSINNIKSINQINIESNQ